MRFVFRPRHLSHLRDTWRFAFRIELSFATGSYQGTISVVPFDVEKHVRALALEGIS
jgi:hypothetical protein